MASLHVRNVEDRLVEQLKKRAAANGRSAEAEHREILKSALQWDRPPDMDRSEWNKRAAEFRESLKGKRHTPSEILIRESRDER